jgi:condensin complex subunit 1
MINKEFVIPLDKDELARTYFGDYSYRKVIPLQLINREINSKILIIIIVSIFIS